MKGTQPGRVRSNVNIVLVLLPSGLTELNIYYNEIIFLIIIIGHCYYFIDINYYCYNHYQCYYDHYCILM